ncbi:MAG: SDR family oxidoreductase [Bacteroidales bacterium]|nr:SDR family oxidoreductase [Bacteroidales bacterium]
MQSLDQKVVIITGASSGIGEALAFEAASRGASLMLAARNIKKLEALGHLLEKENTKVKVCETDVSLMEDCERLIAETLKAYGKIDVLINNAGISMRALFVDTDPAVIHRLMNVNFWGAVYCTKFALPYLLKQKGSVAGISSIAGIKGLPARTGYSASKFAMLGFMESLRIENLKTGLHVLMAFPGFTASNIRNTALAADGSQQGESPRDESKMMTAEEVAVHVLDAIEKRKRTLVLTAQGKLTVWLNKFFPTWVDKLVFNHMAKEPDAPFKKN